MRFKTALPKILCVLGGLALLVPLIAYAVPISATEYGSPNGGSGPPVTSKVSWGWNVYNTLSIAISAWVYPNNSRLMREITAFPDQEMWNWNYVDRNGPLSNNYIPGGLSWADTVSTDLHSSTYMTSGNKYHCDWSSWNVGASDGSENSRPSDKDGTYTCN